MHHHYPAAHHQKREIKIAVQPKQQNGVRFFRRDSARRRGEDPAERERE